MNGVRWRVCSFAACRKACDCRRILPSFMVWATSTRAVLEAGIYALTRPTTHIVSMGYRQHLLLYQVVRPYMHPCTQAPARLCILWLVAMVPTSFPIHWRNTRRQFARFSSIVDRITGLHLLLTRMRKNDCSWSVYYLRGNRGSGQVYPDCQRC